MVDFKQSGATELADIVERARQCTVCAPFLPLGPRPLLQAGAAASVLIIGQAPGIRAHRSGIPWDDNSGERLRDWLGISAATFYDPAQVALVPMGLCYPGVAASGGDNPPRPECAPLWHPQILPRLTKLRLTLLVGSYAQKQVLGRRRGASLTATVAQYADYLPDYLPVPHPSWRVVGWQKRNPWFEAALLPRLRGLVAAALEQDADA